MTELLYREMAVDQVDAETREISGIAVPYGETIEIGGYRERFERGNHQVAADAVLYAVHAHRSGRLPIGRVLEYRDTDAGLWIRARISQTVAGDEAYTLLRDGVITRMSVGFEPGEDYMDGDVLVRTSSVSAEVSVTPHAAYKTAKIAEVRDRTHPEKEKIMPDQVVTTEEVTELRDTVSTQGETITELERRIAELDENRDDTGTAASQYRSAGELLKALATNDDAARAELRAADAVPPATSAQSGADFAGAGWIQRPLKFLVERRRIVNFFDRGPLPAAGNTVEYPEVQSTSGSVGEQANEGDALAYMEVELGTGSATVGTYGGYSALSRQSIERSSQSYLDAVFRFQTIQYAKNTNAAARAALLAMVSANPALTLAAMDAKSWIEVVFDAAGLIEDNSLGLDAEGIIVGRDVAKAIVSIMGGDGRPVFELKGGTGANVIGSANVLRASFDIGGLPGFVDPGLPVDTCKIASSQALTTLESPGAPFRLQDENVINLTKDFSLYGYAAWTENDAAGVVDVDVDLVV